MYYLSSLLFLCLSVSSCSQSSDTDNTVSDASKPPKFDIYIGYGQSNMVGSTFSKLTPSYPLVEKISVCGSSKSVEYLACFQYSEALVPSDIYGRGKYSLWPAYFKEIYSQNLRNKSLLINAAVGGRNLKHLLPCEHSDCSIYDNLMRLSLDVIDDIGTQNIGSINLFFLQGEADAAVISVMDEELFDTKFEEYFFDLDLLIKSFEKDFSGFNFNFNLIRVGAVDSSKFGKKYAALVNDLGFWQIQFCDSHDRCIPNSSLPITFDDENMLMSDDGVHYSVDGYDALGTDIANHIINPNRFSPSLSKSFYPPILVQNLDLSL
jgi:hypothetical protein